MVVGAGKTANRVRHPGLDNRAAGPSDDSPPHGLRLWIACTCHIMDVMRQGYQETLKSGGSWRRWFVSVGTVTTLVLACSGDDGGGDGDTVAGSGGIPTLEATGIVSVSADGEDSDETKFDIGTVATGGTNPEGGDDGCEKVDVVLAIDNSGSMQEEIAALSGPVFDSFPDALLGVNGGLLDFHLGVVDACNAPAHLHNHGLSGDCNFANGANYMVSNNPELQNEYACVTALSTAGWNGTEDECTGENDDEQPANTAADAVSLMAGANMGFLRSDAVLLVVAITDEDEQPLPQLSAQQIADKIIAAAGGIDKVVFLGIAGGSECKGPYGGAEDAVFMREVTQIFVDAERGLFWDLCMGDLEAAFQSVVDVVDVACMEFTPVG